MEFSRFDVVEGYYWFFVHTHEGQGSHKYQRLCKMQRYFRPGRSQDGPSEGGAREVYDALMYETGGEV